MIHSAQNNVFGGFTRVTWDESKANPNTTHEMDTS